MDTTDRYLPLSMVANDDQLCFLDQQKNLISSYPLLKVHLNTADSKDAKFVDKRGRLPAAKLTLQNGTHVRVYFMSFELL